MRVPRQCAILVGGLGTRLGALTADTPKPLLPCGDRPFLAWLLRELSRFGIEDVVLLAGHRSAQVEAFSRDVKPLLPKPVSLRLSVEPAPAGTGGALWHARDLLDDCFLLINGDSWIDTNLARFFAAAVDMPQALGCVLLRKMEDCSRYGVIEMRGRTISAFREKASSVGAGMINSGIYLLDKRVLDFAREKCSLETDVLPELAQRGLLGGHVADGYFIDIGIPDDYARAQRELPRRLHRPAVFFDRDGVLNEDHGWVGTRERFDWIEGAQDTVRLATDAGLHAFVVSNQAGVARGLYTEDAVNDLHRFMTERLMSHGGTIDDIRYCPYHPDAAVAAYRRKSNWRKPAPGMILDLIEKWQVVASKSVLIGNSDTDIEAARAAKIRGELFAGDNLRDAVAPVIYGLSHDTAEMVG